MPFVSGHDDSRRTVSTTNAIAALNARLRRAFRRRGPFPTDDDPS